MWKLAKAALLLVLAIILTFRNPIAEGNDKSNSDVNQSADKFFDGIDKQIPYWLEEYIVPGVAVAFIEDGKVVFKKGYGYADVKNKIKITPRTGFNVGSISKNLTGWAIMKLVEEGKLDLDDPVEKYMKDWKLPSSKYSSKEITIGRLLSHTAGLSLHGFPGYSSKKQLPLIEDVLSGNSNVYEGVKIINEPGTRYKYSGGGYTLLQLVIENISGLSFEEYMHKEVFAPLYMSNSTFGIDDNTIANSSLAHNEYGEQIPLVHFTAKAAAGMHTNLEDLSRFALTALIGTEYNTEEVLLTPSSVTAMTSLAKNSRKSGLSYQVDSVKGESMTLVGHAGDNNGWHSYYSVNRQSGDGLVVMTNGGNYQNITLQVLCHWVDWKVGKSVEHNCKKPLSSKMVNTYRKYGVKKMIATYLKLKKNQSNKYDLNEHGSEQFFNRFGYRLLNRNKIADAIEIFKLNVEQFPRSLNTYDSLGEAYLKANKKELYKTVVKDVLNEVGRSKNRDVNKIGNILIGLGYNMMKLDVYEQAETLLRKAYYIRRKMDPESWTRFNAESLLGEVISKQRKFSEAQAYLHEGYDGLVRNSKKIPRDFRQQRLIDAVKRLIEFYKATDNEAVRKKWQLELDAIRAI